MSKRGTFWRYIGHPNAPYGRFNDIGVKADGSLHNPNSYPEALVREAIDGAIERKRQRRSAAATKAAVTRAERKEAKIYELVKRLKAGGELTPGYGCVFCGKVLDDPESISRSIGSDCWQRVMRAFEEAA